MKSKIKTLINTRVYLVFSLLSLVSCNDFLDVDTDKDSPTSAPIDYLLTNTQVTLNDITNFQNNTAVTLEVYTHQLTVREEQDQYGTKQNNVNVQNEWDEIYNNLNDVETLINQATQSQNLIYAGIAQLEKAYLLSIAVDLWGDIPYSEALKLKTDAIIAPKFDNQKLIYSDILKIIDKAKENINTLKGKKPSKDDLFYGGDTSKWIKFANTFKLKLYNQLKKTDLFNSQDFEKLVTENKFFSTINDDFQFNQTSNTTPTDERNKLFLESYNSAQFTTYISPWFYEIMMGINPKIHAGLKDPRIPYYFYNQLIPDQLPPDNGDTKTGNPKADYWDASTGFFSIRFGSQGPWKDFSTENSYTYPGIFPSGGRYDDGKGGSVATLSDFSGTGIAPHRILTYDEFLYIEAELILAGKLQGDKSIKLKEAITASFAKVDQVVNLNKTAQSIPKLIGTTKTNNFINAIITEFNDATDNTKKLEIIMTQKWVATFGDAADQYNDYRRTGYPILANPNSTTAEYQLNNGNAFPIDDSETTLINPYQQSLFWPLSELNSNKNAPVQKSPGTYKLFWAN